MCIMYLSVTPGNKNLASVILRVSLSARHVEDDAMFHLKWKLCDSRYVHALCARTMLHALRHIRKFEITPHSRLGQKEEW